MHGMISMDERFAEVIGLCVPARGGGVAAALDALADNVEAVVEVLFAVVSGEGCVEVGIPAFYLVLAGYVISCAWSLGSGLVGGW